MRLQAKGSAIPAAVRDVEGEFLKILVPCIEVPKAEDLVLRLLMWPKRSSFSFTKDAEAFITFDAGYHAEGRRLRVDGLSCVLETLKPIVRLHRESLMGRVQVRRSDLTCANCGALYAVVNQPSELNPLLASSGLCDAGKGW